MLIKIKDFPGFYKAAGTKAIAVNKAGDVLNLNNRKIIDRTVGRGDGYLTVNDCGLTRNLHVVMAETFLSCPGDPRCYVVNHKDGNKQNPALSNLEYITYTGNLEHAFKTGLRNDNHWIDLMDLRTNEVIEFYSLQECARHFKRNGEAIHRYLKSKRDAPFMHYYSLRRRDEEWPKLGKDDIGKWVNGKSFDVVAVEISTNKIYIFSGLTNASEYLNISTKSISVNLKRYNGDKPCKGYMFYYLDTYVFESTVTITDTRKDLPLKLSETMKTPPVRKPSMVDVLNRQTGERIIYDSINDFASSLNINVGTIRRSVWKNNGEFKCYLVSYLSNSRKSS